MMRTMILLLLLSLSMSAVAAGTSTGKNSYTQDQIRDLGFEISHELRCPMSVNQNLFDSQAPIAHELKAQIFLMLEQGESKQAIIEFLVQRYGEKIKYQPSFSTATAILWLGPIFLLLTIIATATMLIREQHKHQRNNGKSYE
ncbi:cytochrome c-type biogenesis protein [uncultured Shewanella sp.]|uniref:cytochrome c-type biogenesis protein n=1 Tax=Shewanella atlantica TaxID=271099 RepID=UPI002637C713|nr:cytochrome c-type biogenesis protein [uncultured Shewanella sp.]